jgi:hypothetical protein
MFTFLLISGAQNIAADIYKALSAIGVPQKKPDGRFFIENPHGMEHGWIASRPLIDIQNDYEEDELVEIKKEIENPSFFMIEGRNAIINYSNEFILRFNSDGKTMIDNDHGIIVELSYIKEKIRAGEDWLYLEST